MDAERPTLQRLIGRFTESFAGLGGTAPPLMAEAWAVLVHETMSGRGRQYHTVDHVFDISEGASPLATLSISGGYWLPTTRKNACCCMQK